MAERIIEVQHLSKTFGTHEVLKDIDFSVQEGDVTCILGASGSGKSTLLRCINLLETPSGGQILFHGTPITGRGFDPCAYRAKVGMVFQSFNLFANLTVLENCTIGQRKVLKKSAAEAEATAMEFLEKVGMQQYIKAKPHQLSGGQKQRISIARVFLKNPPILILDEATSALDNESEHIVQQSLAALAQGRTTFTIAHRLSTIQGADLILVLTEDGIAEQGTHEQLLQKHGIYYDLYSLSTQQK